MPKRSRKPPEDEVQAAHRILQAVTGEKEPPKDKNPAAVALGRLGGLKGGRARAERLPKARRSAIAKKAALTRWAKRPKSDSP
jgi:hypothetical protein